MAVKALRLDIVPETAAQVAEALEDLAARPVESRHVVSIVGAGLQGLTPWVACEYVTADTLDALLRRLAPMPRDRAVPLLAQMAEAVEAAWRAGVGHGALHPRDVFVTLINADTSDVRVGGFGIVQALERAGIRVPPRRPYTAPERVAGQGWDMRADVYALGILAHELLTGRRPAAGGEPDGASAPDATSGEQEALRRVLAGALTPDPEQRYATPLAFVEALTSGAVPAMERRGAAPARAAGAIPGRARPVSTPPPAPPESLQGDAPATPPPVASAPIAPIAPSSPGRPAHRRAPHAAPDLASHELRRDRGDVPYVPRVSASTAKGPVAGLVAVALVAAAGLGLWWRLSPSAPAGEEPIGTEVRVGDDAADAEGRMPAEWPAPAPGDAVAAPMAAPMAAPAPAAPAPRSAPPPARARLLVRSEPSGAQVSISGRQRGTTPATIRDLPFGTYNVTVARPGYQTRVERVTMSRATPARDITVVLRPAAPAAPAATTGALYLETRPAGAQVTIDGRLLGTTPMRVPDLAPGTHAVLIELAGHRSVTTTVVVRAGQVVPVRVSLERM